MHRAVAAAALLAIVSVSGDGAGMPYKYKKRPPSRVKISKVEPSSVKPGDKITVTGEHLDDIVAVLLGNFVPEIVEKTPKRLVFVTPDDDREPYANDYPYFLVSGRPVLVSKTEIHVTPTGKDDKKAGASKGSVVVDEDGTITASTPKSWDVPLEGASDVEIDIRAKGGELEAKVEAIPGHGEPQIRATYSGLLRWTVSARDVGRPSAVRLTLAGDAKKVTFHAKVTRAGAAPAPPAAAPGAAKTSG